MLPFAGTDPHNGDKNENVGDEDGELGTCEVHPCGQKQGSLLYVSVRTWSTLREAGSAQ